MSILDQVSQQVLGSFAQSNPQIVTVATELLAKNGGIEGLIGKFNQGGLKDIFMSWVGTGSNLPISADQISQVLGSDTVKNLAQTAGIDSQVISQQIADHLPGIIDMMTPNGQIPTGAATGQSDLGATLGNIASSIFGGKA